MTKVSIRTLIVVALTLLVTTEGWAQTCDSTPERHAAAVLGRDAAGTLSADVSPFIAGSDGFFQEIGAGWTFALLPGDYGWSLRLFDGPGPDAMDLTQITPPFHGPNARDIFGWHFRNADNTAPNTGDVNAPQHLRLFYFSPELSGTGGYKPPPEGTPAAEPVDAGGRGWLKIEDMGLAELAVGQKARINYLKFSACITWSKSQEEQQVEADLASPTFTEEDLEHFGGCGLDLGTYDLHAALLPRKLGGDLDGDGALDEIAQVRRKADGKRGLALCRAGTWLELLGFDGRSIGADLATGYFDQMEAWNWETIGAPSNPLITSEALRTVSRDYIVLERIEKQIILLYWENEGLESKQIFRFVEP